MKLFKIRGGGRKGKTLRAATAERPLIPTCLLRQRTMIEGLESRMLLDSPLGLALQYFVTTNPALDSSNNPLYWTSYTPVTIAGAPTVVSDINQTYAANPDSG